MAAYTLIPCDHPCAGSIIARWASSDDYSYAMRRRLGAGETLLARAALRALLALSTKCNDWVFRNDERGKLLVDGRSGSPGPHVSLTHTLGAIACTVVASAPVGIDIERQRPRAYAAISTYAFGPRECERIEQEGLQAFYRIWTLREAMGKATGDGLALVADGIDRAEDGPHVGCWSVRKAERQWLLAHHCAYTDLSLSFAVLVRENANESLRPLSQITAEEL